MTKFYGMDEFTSIIAFSLISTALGLAFGFFLQRVKNNKRQELAIKEANELVNTGVKEITLLGQNVNAYNYKDEKNVVQEVEVIKIEYHV